MIRRTLRLGLAFAVAASTTLVVSPTAGGRPQRYPDDTWMTNGQVYTIAKSGNTIYIGGKFQSVRQCPPGQSCGAGSVVNVLNLAALDATTGAAIKTFRPQVGAPARLRSSMALPSPAASCGRPASSRRLRASRDSISRPTTSPPVRSTPGRSPRSVSIPATASAASMRSATAVRRRLLHHRRRPAAQTPRGVQPRRQPNGQWKPRTGASRERSPPRVTAARSSLAVHSEGRRNDRHERRASQPSRCSTPRRARSTRGRPRTPRSRTG